MALLGIRSAVLLTTDEMSESQFMQFRLGWIRYEARKLRRDGISEFLARRTAEDEFEFLRKKGFKELNDNVLRNREIRARSRSLAE